MKKRLVSLLLAVCLITASYVSVFAAYEEELPSSFDLRERGVVTPVKTQRPWSTCWSFASIAAAETSILSAMGKTYEETGLDLSERHIAWYSKFPVVVKENSGQAGEGYYPIDENYIPNHIFEYGGEGNEAASLWAMGLGPVYESEYPYQNNEGTLEYDTLINRKDEWIEDRIAQLHIDYAFDSTGNMTEEDFAEKAEKDYYDALASCAEFDYYSSIGDWTLPEQYTGGAAFTLTDYNNFYYNRDDDESNEIRQDEKIIENLKRELLLGHGIDISFYYSITNLNKETWAYYEPTAKTLNHAVCIVGWDDNFSADNFLTPPPADGAWLVKNSYGSETEAIPDGLTAADSTKKNANSSDFGILDDEGRHTGYFWVSYYNLSIQSVKSYVFAPVENNDLSEALQYDYAAEKELYVGNESDCEISSANVYTIDKDCRITSVGTTTFLPVTHGYEDFDARIDIYKLDEDAETPDDGTKIATQEKHFDYAGYHRIYLDNPVYLKDGDRIGVKATYWHENEDGSRIYAIQSGYHKSEFIRSLFNFDYAEVIVNPGESFMYVKTSDDADYGWYDIGAPMNIDLWNMVKSSWASDEPPGKSLAEYARVDNYCIKVFIEPCDETYTMTSYDGREITYSIDESGIITVSGNGNIGESECVLVCSYNEDGKLIGVNIVGSEDKATDVTVEDAAKVRIMWWENGNIKPNCKNVIIEF